MFGTTVGNGICTEEQAKMIAEKFFKHYAQKEDEIDNISIMSMIVDAYKTLGIQIETEKFDNEGYHQSLDQNHDGRIKLDDIEQLAFNCLVGGSKRQKWIEKQRGVAERLFKQHDKDNSGYLDYQELEELLQETYKAAGIEKDITQSELNRSINLYDKNKTGKVSFVEFNKQVVDSLEKHANEMGIE